jgi:hypothetical protein
MEEVSWRVIRPGFDSEAPVAPMEISDNSQFTVMPTGTQLAVPNTFASFVSKSEKTTAISMRLSVAGKCSRRYGPQ